MDGDEGIDGSVDSMIEGSVKLSVTPSGTTKGPASRGGVFFNPAMVQNRDLSVLLLEYLSVEDLLPGKKKRVLDGLCGSGARAIRIGAETGLLGRDVEIVGTDINPASIRSAEHNAHLNGVHVSFIRTDLNQHLLRERYSYIDIDPFGSPVPFLHAAIQALVNGGILGVTATDTAALTGSVPRVSWRRYGTRMVLTHAYQEMACRNLVGYMARLAAVFERGIEPLLFYSSDHFVRGYLRIGKGAGKADRSLGNLNWVQIKDPGPPLSSVDHRGAEEIEGARFHGPIWTGNIEEPEVTGGILREVSRGGRWDQIQSRGSYEVMMERAAREHDLPILGYDVNILASFLKVSPPSMERISDSLLEGGHRFTRSRFSPTIFKTDADRKHVHEIFLGGR